MTKNLKIFGTSEYRYTPMTEGYNINHIVHFKCSKTDNLLFLSTHLTNNKFPQNFFYFH